MNSDSVPLYLGIPLALLCLAVVAVVVALGWAMWKDRQR